MIAYTTNILPTDAAYYTLTNATLVAGQLHLYAGGSATIEVTSAQLATLTEYFRVTAVMSPSSGDYVGRTYISIKIISTSGSYISHFCNIATDASGIFSTEIEAIAEEYSFLQVVIWSDVECVFTSWGLEPEASNGDIQTEIDGVKQSLPRLIYDYNTTAITVEEEEQLVGLISCYLIANTDLQGHFLMNVNAQARCTIHLRFYDNNMEELFSPLLFTINAGATVITVPHAYLNKLVGIHNFTITAQVTNGSLSIPIRSMLYTIDGGYLAERLLNPGINVQDIAIQQLSTDEEPSAVYAVGVDNDIITVKKHAYTPSDANEAWEAVYTLGEGVIAALEFDGDWERRTGNSFFTLNCEETPWVFWTDSTGTLYAQRGAVTSTKVTLATGVSFVRAVRGYKSTIYTVQDQGLVVAYLKSGTVYYRNYCRQADASILWEEERALTALGTDLTSVHVHRLNDYRLGFVGSSPTANKWLITERTYVGAAVAPETIVSALRLYGNMAVVPVGEEDYVVTLTPTVSETDYTDLYVTCNYNLFARVALADCLTFTSSNSGVTVESYEIVDNVLHIKLNSWPGGAHMYVAFDTELMYAYLPNCGYVMIPGDTLEFLIIVRHNQPAESVSITPGISGTIEQKNLAVYDGYDYETIPIALSFSAISIVQKYITITTHSTNSETIEIAFSITGTIVESFVGTEPI
jgi:hypothetical protein